MTYSTFLTTSSDYSEQERENARPKQQAARARQRKSVAFLIAQKATSTYTACVDHKKLLDAMLKQADKTG